MNHTASNTPPGTKVFVNGYEVAHAMSADPKNGVVVYAPYPYKLKRPERGRVYTRKLRGVVTLEMPK